MEDQFLKEMLHKMMFNPLLKFEQKVSFNFKPFDIWAHGFSYVASLIFLWELHVGWGVFSMCIVCVHEYLRPVVVK